MTARQDILTMAANQEKAARMAVEAGERFGYDASREALEYADIARILRLAAKEMEHMAPDAQQDYAHRLKFAVWARLDDSPEVPASQEEPS